MHRTLFLVLIAVLATSAVKLPKYFPKCSKSNDQKLIECMTKSANAGFSTFVKGDNTYRVQPMNPLKVQKIDIDVSGGLAINLTNAEIQGIDQITFDKVLIDFDKKTIRLVYDMPIFRVLGNYTMKGKLLILNINGNGFLDVAYDNPHATLAMDYDIIEKNKKQYIVPKNEKLTYKVSLVRYRLDNLFNGDKRLGEEMNKFMNENWQEVDKEIGVKIAEAVALVNRNILANFFGRVPLTDFFDE